jgi:hypothetical protein
MRCQAFLDGSSGGRFARLNFVVGIVRAASNRRQLMKFLIFTMGPGETSHGYAFARYLLKKEQQVAMALLYESNLHFCCEALEIPITITPTPEALQTLVWEVRPDVVVLCNSKSFNDDRAFVERSPWPGVPTFSIDSNWLFDLVGPHQFLRWLDAYFIVLPEPLFKLGCKEAGGHFYIPFEWAAQIHPTGFLPAYQKPDALTRALTRQALGVQTHEQLLFCYLSGYGARARGFVLEHAFRAVRHLRSQGRAIKLLALGNLDLVEGREQYQDDWLTLRSKASAEEFYALLASADLVFQHQGHGTLSQAISAQVPVIVNIEVRADISYPLIPLAENLPFQQAGVCQLLYSHSPLEEVEAMIEKLLYDKQEREKMQSIQKKYAIPGDSGIYSLLMEQLLPGGRVI